VGVKQELVKQGVIYKMKIKIGYAEGRNKPIINDICSNCGVVCTPDDECYNDYKTNKPLCDNCSVFDEEKDAYTLMKKYKVILADPPWRLVKGGKKKARPNTSGKPLDYPTMDLQEIKSLLSKFSKMGEENHVMFLWTIEKYLPQAEAIAKELGYKLHVRMVWNKVTGIPSAFTIRYGHEYMLYLYKIKLPKIALSERGKIHSVFTEQVKKHSQKPEISFNIIERLYPDCNKLELFARRKRVNWDAWGNEIDNDLEIGGVVQDETSNS